MATIEGPLLVLLNMLTLLHNDYYYIIIIFIIIIIIINYIIILKIAISFANKGICMLCFINSV